ncbi:retrovirus-related Pol polyprotein from transposon 297 [Trichonephila clavipes]|nr:retrovirus-related Pol polyprotein from transposon 297 [Trichonephila clavipes]
MKIILSDEKPIAQRSRRLSLPEKREVEKQIDEWLEQGIIRESCSDFSSPVVVCKKKDGTMRLCIDYRKLNKKIVKDRYPLPIIEEVLDKLGNGKIFTTLDLKNAFFHVDVDEASRKYTAFVTETGQYEFLKVPFGLSISSNYFQRYINYVFRELLRDGTLIIYLDDIIIPATDEKEACKKLARVLETASRYGIELNLKKCQFLQGKINFFRACDPERYNSTFGGKDSVSL